MASKKQHMSVRDYEAAPAPEVPDTESVAHQFILVEEGDDKPAMPAREISEEEQERRDLKARFKRLRGYKPTIKDLDELRRTVAQLEHEAQLKKDGIL